MASKKENDFLVKLGKTYAFEGKDYNEIDLSGVEKLTTEDLAEAQDMMENPNKLVPEFDYGYLMILASKATSLPLEFFKGLPASDGISVKGVITDYFFND